jgi:ATP-dependent helicase/nuclease subunit A
MTGNSTLNQSLEIRELVNLLTFLRDIDHNVALVAVLKGLFFGFSDNELYQFKYRGGFFNIYGTVPGDLEENLAIRFKRAFEQLKDYHQWSKKYPPAVTLEIIMIELGLLPFASTREMALSRCGNLFYLLERIKDAEAKGVTTFNGMVEEIKRIIDSSIEKELNITLEEDVVRIMNLHKAKGLEAPVVFLAHPFKDTSIAPDCHIQCDGFLPRGYFCFSHKKNYYPEILAQPANWEQYQLKEVLYQQAEEVRLLYVAATRSADYLQQ